MFPHLMHLLVTKITLLNFILNHGSQAEGPSCFNCEYEADPFSCNKIIKCSEDQKCFSTYYVEYHYGESYWDTGCKTKAFCSAFGSRRLVKRSNYERNVTENNTIPSGESSSLDDHQLPERALGRDGRLTVCLSCCVGDYCNLLPCDYTSSNKPSPKGLTCPSCSGIGDPADCTVTEHCQVGQLCAVWTNDNGSVSLGCRDKSVCDAQGNRILYGKRGLSDDGFEYYSYHLRDISDDKKKPHDSSLKTKAMTNYETNSAWIDERNHLSKRTVDGCRACCDSSFCSLNYCSKIKSLPNGVVTVTLPSTTTFAPAIAPLIVNVSILNPSIYEGDNVTVTCLIQGFAFADVTISLRNNNNQSQNLTVCERNTTTPSISSLNCEIFNVKKSQSGRLICTSGYFDQTWMAEENLNVQEKVPLTTVIKPKDTIVKLNVLTKVLCHIDGKPIPDYTWYKNESGNLSKITRSSFVNIEVESNHTAILEIQPLGKDSLQQISGDYICQAENRFDVKRLTFQMNSISPISVERSPTDVVVTKSKPSSVVFSCGFSSYPPVNIKWFYQRDPDQFQPLQFPNIILGSKDHTVTSNLTIATNASTQVGDTNYKCEASNGYNSTFLTATLTVQSFPHILTPQQSYTVVKGNNLTVPCTVEGYPPPSISWQFLDEYGFPVILAGAVIKDSGARLFVDSADISGTLTCYARNTVGVETVSFRINVN